jgi:hypothetical protein
MKGILLNIVLLIILSSAVYSCNNRDHYLGGLQTVIENAYTQKSIYKKKNFDSLLKIAEKSPPEFKYEEVLRDTAFQELFDHSPNYLNDVKEFLLNKKFTYDEVTICICAMQTLDVDDYVKFCEVCADLFDQNKISEGDLYLLLRHGFLQRRIIIENYKDPSVVKLLNQLHNDKKTSLTMKSGIEDILAGKMSD